METPILDGIRKEARFNWGHVGGILGGLGALSSIAYATISLKDRHDRQQREKQFNEIQQALNEIRGFYPQAAISLAPTDHGIELVPTPTTKGIV